MKETILVVNPQKSFSELITRLEMVFNKPKPTFIFKMLNFELEYEYCKFWKAEKSNDILSVFNEKLVKHYFVILAIYAIRGKILESFHFLLPLQQEFKIIITQQILQCFTTLKEFHRGAGIAQ